LCCFICNQSNDRKRANRRESSQAAGGIDHVQRCDSNAAGRPQYGTLHTP
jgi:hypothetical protein